jgi:hypothetical protein
LDSICPTGSGKVAGVKIEKRGAKLAGRAEVMARQAEGAFAQNK